MAQTDASIFPLEFLKKKLDSQKINSYFLSVIRKLSSKLLKLRRRKTNLKTLILYASLRPFLKKNEIFSYLEGRAKLKHLLKSFCHF